MKFAKLDYLYSALLFLISVIFISDLFFHSGRPATFDTTFHITNIAQYYLALKDGDFPVVWLGGFANYGLPIGIVAHQMTSYLGAFFTFFTHDPIVSFNIVAFIGIFLANLFLYFFLRIYATPNIAFVSTFLFNFSTYRIINFYIRGAIPEIFSNLFLPLIMIGMYLVIKRGRKIGIPLLLFSFFGLTLNHPMMLLIYSLVYVPYFIFLLFFDEDARAKTTLKEKITQTLLVGISAGIGVLLGSYYLLPLFLEIKYFYYGTMPSHFTPNNYLGLKNYFDMGWYYFTPTEIYTRGHVINFGIINTLGLVAGLIYFIYAFIQRKRSSLFYVLGFCLVVSLLIIFFTLRFSDVFDQHISLLSNIQFPWRIPSVLIFLPPLIYVILLKDLKKQFILPVLVLIISLLSFPQLYLKNYWNIDESEYFFSVHNAHSVLMNTIWTGKTEEYPVEKNKPAIVTGDGKIISSEVHNSSRLYKINAETPLRMVDYTFYFPGWKVLIDNQEAPIEFQDPAYRGVITYNVPKGEHVVSLKFENTKVRRLGDLLSLAALGLAGIYLLIIYFIKPRRLLPSSTSAPLFTNN